MPAYVALRREALVNEPHAFAASPSDDRALDPEYLQRAFAEPDQATFGAFVPELVGIAGVSRVRREKTAHKAFFWGLYVAPGHRGRGIGRALVEAAIGFARTLPGVTQVQLCVSEQTPAASALYERLGFVTWGIEPEALRVGTELVADRHMILRLDRTT